MQFVRVEEGLKPKEKAGEGVRVRERERETPSEEEQVGNPRYVFPVPLSHLKFLDLIIRLLEAPINIEEAFADVTLCCPEWERDARGRGGHPRQK